LADGFSTFSNGWGTPCLFFALDPRDISRLSDWQVCKVGEELRGLEGWWGQTVPF
jgi:hypothetical protein